MEDHLHTLSTPPPYCENPNTDSPLPLIQHGRDERSFWLCQHKSLKFDELRFLLSSAADLRSKDIERTDRLRFCKVCHEFRDPLICPNPDRLGEATGTISTCHHIFQASCLPSIRPDYSAAFSRNRLTDALQNLDIPVCAHLRLDLNMTLSHFAQRKLPEQHPFLSLKPFSPILTNPPKGCGGRLLVAYEEPARCLVCYGGGYGTEVRFCVTYDTCPNGHDASNLVALVHRYLQQVNTTDDSSWLQHSLLLPESESMSRAWERCVDHIGIGRPQCQGIRDDHIVQTKTNLVSIQDGESKIVKYREAVPDTFPIVSAGNTTVGKLTGEISVASVSNTAPGKAKAEIPITSVSNTALGKLKVEIPIASVSNTTVGKLAADLQEAAVRCLQYIFVSRAPPTDEEKLRLD